jgi:hypothetical protein
MTPIRFKCSNPECPRWDGWYKDTEPTYLEKLSGLCGYCYGCKEHKMGAEFSSMIGKTITGIENLDKFSDNVFFACSDGSVYGMYHRQDCCEHVRIEDVCGDVDDLIGSPVINAEEVSNADMAPVDDSESFTWTFYKLETVKGSVTIRWYGCSNGYYSESVDFFKVK